MKAFASVFVAINTISGCQLIVLLVKQYAVWTRSMYPPYSPSRRELGLMPVSNLLRCFGGKKVWRPRKFGGQEMERGTRLLLMFISLLFAPLLTSQNEQKSPSPVLPSTALGSPLIIWSQSQKPAPLPVSPNVKGKPSPAVPRSVDSSSWLSHTTAEVADDRVAKPPSDDYVPSYPDYW